LLWSYNFSLFLTFSFNSLTFLNICNIYFEATINNFVQSFSNLGSGFWSLFNIHYFKNSLLTFLNSSWHVLALGIHLLYKVFILVLLTYYCAKLALSDKIFHFSFCPFINFFILKSKTTFSISKYSLKFSKIFTLINSFNHLGFNFT